MPARTSRMTFRAMSSRVADLSEYPRFMCRPGTQEAAWGHQIDTTSATSPEHEEELAGAGWYRTPGEWGEYDRLAADPRTDDELRQEIARRDIKLHHKAGRAKMLEALA